MNITNYFEALVLDVLTRELAGTPKMGDMDYLEDVACVALNKLPARYVRHIVDARFYESSEELGRVYHVVEKRVAEAIRYIDARQGLNPDGSAHQKIHKGQD